VRFLRCCSALLALSACGGEVTPEGELATAAPAPAVGDAGDSADRACQVILRSLTRGTDDCSSGACVARWTGALDVAVGTVARGAVPAVLLGSRPGAQWVWQEIRTTAEGTPQGGFQRYGFHLTDATLARGPSATALARFTLAVAPFVRLGDGSRAFDHNRVPGDLDTYVLNQANRWTIGEAAATCPATVAGPARGAGLPRPAGRSASRARWWPARGCASATTRHACRSATATCTPDAPRGARCCPPAGCPRAP
jgi:hypothetical protein